LENSNYLKQLDGVRFIAVTLVLIDHWTGDKIGFPISYLGVCMFFVLSGFLITRILLNAKQKDDDLGRGYGQSLKSFFIRRTIRIFPIYYLTIFALFLLNVLPVREKIWWCLGYATNIYVATHGTWLGSIDHLWSLAVEEQFYIFFPFVVFFTPIHHLTKVLYGFIYLSVGLRLYFVLTGHSWITPYVLMPTCLDAFGMGGILAYFFWSKNPAVKEFITNKVLLITSLVLYICVVLLAKQLSQGHNIITDVFLRGFEALLSLFIVGNAAYQFGTAHSSFVSKGIKTFLENRLIVYIGRISYGIYLYHFFLYNPYISIPDNPHHPMAITVKVLNKINKLIPQLADYESFKVLVLYTMVIIISTVSWYLIEKPINALKEKFGY
jgi:peptidoglycan/LPS O-acetylase OafA/YrhL